MSDDLKKNIETLEERLIINQNEKGIVSSQINVLRKMLNKSFDAVSCQIMRKDLALRTISVIPVNRNPDRMIRFPSSHLKYS